MHAAADNGADTIIPWAQDASLAGIEHLYRVASRFQSQVEIVIGHR